MVLSKSYTSPGARNLSLAYWVVMRTLTWRLDEPRTVRSSYDAEQVLDPHGLGLFGGEVGLRLHHRDLRPCVRSASSAASLIASRVPSGSSFSPGFAGTTHAFFPSLSKGASTGSLTTSGAISARNSLSFGAERTGTSVEHAVHHLRRELQGLDDIRPRSGSTMFSPSLSVTGPLIIVSA